MTGTLFPIKLDKKESNKNILIISGKTNEKFLTQKYFKNLVSAHKRH